MGSISLQFGAVCESGFFWALSLIFPNLRTMNWVKPHSNNLKIKNYIFSFWMNECICNVHVCVHVYICVYICLHVCVCIQIVCIQIMCMWSLEVIRHPPSPVILSHWDRILLYLSPTVLSTVLACFQAHAGVLSSYHHSCRVSAIPSTH